MKVIHFLDKRLYSPKMGMYANMDVVRLKTMLRPTIKSVSHFTPQNSCYFPLIWTVV